MTVDFYPRSYVFRSVLAYCKFLGKESSHSGKVIPSFGYRIFSLMQLVLLIFIIIDFYSNSNGYIDYIDLIATEDFLLKLKFFCT